MTYTAVAPDTPIRRTTLDFNGGFYIVLDAGDHFQVVEQRREHFGTNDGIPVTTFPATEETAALIADRGNRRRGVTLAGLAIEALRRIPKVKYKPGFLARAGAQNVVIESLVERGVYLVRYEKPLADFLAADQRTATRLVRRDQLRPLNPVFHRGH